MTPDIEKIEHLINAKTFEELSSSERKLVLAHLSGKSEYEHMRETLLRVKKAFNAEAEAMQTDTVLKEQILNRFEQNKPKPTSIFDQISTFFQTLIPSPVGRFSAVLGMLLFVITIGFFMWPNQRYEMAQRIIQKNESPVINNDDSIGLSSPPSPPVETQEQELANATEKAIGFHTPIVTMEALKESDDNYAYEEVTADELKVPSPVIVENGVTLEKQNQKPANYVEQSNAVFTNNEGFKQYNTPRSAEINKTESSDAYKDYSDKAKKIAERKEKYAIDQTGSGKATTAKAEKDVEIKSGINAGSTTQNVAVPAEMETLQRAKDDKSISSIPVWAGVENKGDAYEATVSKIKLFVSKSLSNSTVESLKGQSINLQLVFNEKGEVKKAVAKGYFNEELKNEIETTALKLPAFKFSNGKKGELILQQKYIFNFE